MEIKLSIENSVNTVRYIDSSSIVETIASMMKRTKQLDPEKHNSLKSLYKYDHLCYNFLQHNRLSYETSISNNGIPISSYWMIWIVYETIQYTTSSRSIRLPGQKS